MKALRRNRKGYTFIVPLVVVSIVAFAGLSIGVYVVGQLNDSLESTFPNNRASGRIDEHYMHNGTTGGWRNYTLPTGCSMSELSGAITQHRVHNNGTGPIWFNLSSNNNVTYNQTILANHWVNTTLTSVIASGNVTLTDTYLNFTWATNQTINVSVRIYGVYHISSDYRTVNENSTVELLGNVTDGFSDTVDVEIAVIILVGLSLGIATVVMLTRRRRI